MQLHQANDREEAWIWNLESCVQESQIWVPKQQILRHKSSHCTLETSNPTDWVKIDLIDFGECSRGEKFQIHWETLQWDSSWREICSRVQQILGHESTCRAFSDLKSN